VESVEDHFGFGLVH